MSNAAQINRTNVNHDLNCWAEYYDAIAAGFKTADVRRTDDRANIVVGDTITFLRVDKDTGAPTYVDPSTGMLVVVDDKTPDAVRLRARVQKCKVLVTHKTSDAGALSLFGVRISEWNRPAEMVPVVALSISVIE